MSIVEAVIFDLDNTLVNTSRLEAYRTTKDHQGLIKNLDKSRIYSPVKIMLEKIKEQKVPIALVTNSPRWYTDEVLKYHSIDIFDIIVCYDDVGPDGVKPSTKGLDLVLSKLNLNRNSKTIYIGDQDTDFIASYAANIKPIAPSWGQRDPINQIPAAIVNSETLINSLGNYDELSLIADRTASKKEFNFPKSQLNFIPLNDKGELVALNKKDIKLITFGRYFSQNSTLTANLHEKHQLSKDVFAKELSTSYTIPQYYINLMTRVVETLPIYIFESQDIKFDIITVIPSKKEKNPRLENMLNRIKSLSTSKSEFITDLFEFAPGASSLKTLGGKDLRLQELKEKLFLKSKYESYINGKTVLILDDVITTGSTFQHAFALLKSANAQFSFGASLAKTVSIQESQKNCPKCGRVMRIRSNKKTRIHFYGCTGYFETINKCDHIENIKIKDCPKCEGDLITRYNSFQDNYFLACTEYATATQCRHTENVDNI